jgi:hypothetical protein
VVLLPTIESIAAREAARRQAGYHSFSIEQLYEAFLRDTPEVGLWLDTSDLTPDPASWNPS